MSSTADDIAFEAVAQDTPIVKLLERHKAGKQGMFIVHMDRTPMKEKRFAFGLQFALSAVLAALILWRIVSGKGKYLPLLLPDNMGLMDRVGARPSSSISEFLWTSLNIAFDTILALLGKILLLPFATGSLWMRLRFGLRAAEPVFRCPTEETALAQLRKLAPEERLRRMRQETLKAVDRKHVDTCAGDFMTIGIWVVDYAAARDASAMLEKRELREDDLELSVYVLDAEGIWTVWRVPRK